jgi:hypothetical protein
VDRSLKGRVKLLLIDDTRVEVRGREMALFAALEPLLRRIVYMRFFEAANIFTALTFMKKIKASTGRRSDSLRLIKFLRLSSARAKGRWESS